MSEQTQRGIPRFGDWFTSVWAGDENPHRHGIFVRAGRRPHGRMNPGPFYELTDGEGAFWQIGPDSVVRGRLVPSEVRAAREVVR